MRKLVFISLFAVSLLATAETFQFTPPILKVDGSVYTDRGVYRILLRDSITGIVTTTADFPDDGFIDTIIYTVPPGIHYISLVAMNVSGTASDESNQIVVSGGDVMMVRPNTPTDFRVMP